MRLVYRNFVQEYNTLYFVVRKTCLMDHEKEYQQSSVIRGIIISKLFYPKQKRLTTEKREKKKNPRSFHWNDVYSYSKLSIFSYSRWLRKALLYEGKQFSSENIRTGLRNGLIIGAVNLIPDFIFFRDIADQSWLCWQYSVK